MKQLLLHVLTCCAILLPIQEASAQKKFGDLAPRTKFKMVVTKVTATVNEGKGIRKVKVPATMPQFKVKDKIAFTIGAQGQLNGKLRRESFSLPFVGSSPALNSYAFNDVGLVTITYNAALGKNLKKKPSTLELYFNRIEANINPFGIVLPPGIGGSTKAYTVIYQLRAVK